MYTARDILEEFESVAHPQRVRGLFRFAWRRWHWLPRAKMGRPCVYLEETPEETRARRKRIQKESMKRAQADCVAKRAGRALALGAPKRNDLG